jgi:hypothetical protein
MKINNIKSGEILRLDASFEELTQIVVALLRGKYAQHVERTDDELVADCMQYIHQYEQQQPDVSVISTTSVEMPPELPTFA